MASVLFIQYIKRVKQGERNEKLKHQRLLQDEHDRKIEACPGFFRNFR
jgi:hypothetical protein